MLFWTDLRHFQPRNAANDPVSERLRQRPHQRHGGVLPGLAGALHSRHAASLRLLTSRDDQMGPRHL